MSFGRGFLANNYKFCLRPLSPRFGYQEARKLHLRDCQENSLVNDEIDLQQQLSTYLAYPHDQALCSSS